MVEEFVTKEELAKLEHGTKEEIAKLEKNMSAGFVKIEKQLDMIMHNMAMEKHTDLEKYDSRYMLRSEDISNSVDRLSNPRVRKMIYTVVSEYLDTPDGALKMRCVIDRYFVEKRDNTSKWISFIKLVAIMVISLLVGYSGMTIYKDNMATQQEIVKTIQQMNIGD